MFRWILVLAAAGLAYWRFQWPGAVAVIVLYFVLNAIWQSVQAANRRKQADRLCSTPLSDDEKKHYMAAGEHQKAMEDHRAQFDPELRKSRTQPR